MRHLIKIVLFLIVALVIAACGTSSPGNENTTAAPVYQSASPGTSPKAATSGNGATATATGTNSTGSTLSAADLIHSVTFTLAADGGYLGSGTLRFGAPVALSTDQSLSDDGQSAGVGSACKIDSASDAAIPFAVQVTNTTPNFPAQIAFGLSPFAVDSQGHSPAIEQTFSNGPVCHSVDLGGTNAIGGGVTGQMSKDEKATFLGFYIIHNFYSPIHPTGDSALLAQQQLLVMAANDDGNRRWTVSGFTGSTAEEYTFGFRIRMGGR